ncbi:Fimbrin [Diplonema papillatum]|nr:Fimbrin [Diplonema papillatum]
MWTANGGVDAGPQKGSPRVNTGFVVGTLRKTTAPKISRLNSRMDDYASKELGAAGMQALTRYMAATDEAEAGEDGEKREGGASSSPSARDLTASRNQFDGNPAPPSPSSRDLPLAVASAARTQPEQAYAAPNDTRVAGRVQTDAYPAGSSVVSRPEDDVADGKPLAIEDTPPRNPACAEIRPTPPKPRQNSDDTPPPHSLPNPSTFPGARRSSMPAPFHGVFMPEPSARTVPKTRSHYAAAGSTALLPLSHAAGTSFGKRVHSMLVSHEPDRPSPKTSPRQLSSHAKFDEILKREVTVTAGHARLSKRGMFDVFDQWLLASLYDELDAPMIKRSTSLMVGGARPSGESLSALKQAALSQQQSGVAAAAAAQRWAALVGDQMRELPRACRHSFQLRGAGAFLLLEKLAAAPPADGGAAAPQAFPLLPIQPQHAAAARAHPADWRGACISLCLKELAAAVYTMPDSHDLHTMSAAPPPASELILKTPVAIAYRRLQKDYNELEKVASRDARVAEIKLKTSRSRHRSVKAVLLSAVFRAWRHEASRAGRRTDLFAASLQRGRNRVLCGRVLQAWKEQRILAKADDVAGQQERRFTSSVAKLEKEFGEKEAAAEANLAAARAEAAALRQQVAFFQREVENLQDEQLAQDKAAQALLLSATEQAAEQRDASRARIDDLEARLKTATDETSRLATLTQDVIAAMGRRSVTGVLPRPTLLAFHKLLAAMHGSGAPRGGEVSADRILQAFSPDRVLLYWVRHCVSSAGAALACKTPVNNFSTSMQDGEVLCAVVGNAFPAHGADMAAACKQLDVRVRIHRLLDFLHSFLAPEAAAPIRRRSVSPGSPSDQLGASSTSLRPSLSQASLSPASHGHGGSSPLLAGPVQDNVFTVESILSGDAEVLLYLVATLFEKWVETAAVALTDDEYDALKAQTVVHEPGLRRPSYSGSSTRRSSSSTHNSTSQAVDDAGLGHKPVGSPAAGPAAKTAFEKLIEGRRVDQKSLDAEITGIEQSHAGWGKLAKVLKEYAVLQIYRSRGAPDEDGANSVDWAAEKRDENGKDDDLLALEQADAEPKRGKKDSPVAGLLSCPSVVVERRHRGSSLLDDRELRERDEFTIIKPERFAPATSLYPCPSVQLLTATPRQGSSASRKLSTTAKPMHTLDLSPEDITGVQRVFLLHYRMLRRIHFHYTRMSSKSEALGLPEFIKLLSDCKMIAEGASGSLGSTKTQSAASFLVPGQAEQLFARVTDTALGNSVLGNSLVRESSSTALSESVRSSGSTPVPGMRPTEFIEAVLRLAAMKYQKYSASVPSKLAQFIVSDILPRASWSDIDAVRTVFRSARVQDVINDFKPSLLKIFQHYSMDDKLSNCLTMNVKEFWRLLCDSKMSGEALSQHSATLIFNNCTTEEGPGNDELRFNEFTVAMTASAITKNSIPIIPAAHRLRAFLTRLHANLGAKNHRLRYKGK